MTAILDRCDAQRAFGGTTDSDHTLTTGEGVIPAGSIMAYGGGTAPSGWILWTARRSVEPRMLLSLLPLECYTAPGMA